MATIDTAARALHVLFAGLWTGGVVFVAAGVLPMARGGDIRPGALGTIVTRLTTLSRASAVVLLLTGGHLAAESYTADRLLYTTEGTLVVVMVVLWLALAALVEVAASRLRDGLDRDRVRTPAERSAWLYATASLVGVAALLVGGVLAA